MEQLRKEKPINIPNLLTFARIALLPAIAVRFRQGDSFGAMIIYFVAMLTDAADGMIARKTNRITALGKLLDPIADKLCLLTLLSLFAAGGQIPAWLLYVVILKEVILIVGSWAAFRQGLVVSALPIGKATTFSFVLSTIVRFLNLRIMADYLLWISLLLSFAALVWYSVEFFRKLHLRSAIA